MNEYHQTIPLNLFIIIHVLMKPILDNFLIMSSHISNPILCWRCQLLYSPHFDTWKSVSLPTWHYFIPSIFLYSWIHSDWMLACMTIFSHVFFQLSLFSSALMTSFHAFIQIESFNLNDKVFLQIFVGIGFNLTWCFYRFYWEKIAYLIIFVQPLWYSDLDWFSFMFFHLLHYHQSLAYQLPVVHILFSW
jgi:hypothetical protein